MLKLQVKGSTRSAWLVPPKLTIGQDKTNELVIPEKGVGDFHLEISVEGQELSIAKIGEGASCTVNGSVATEGHPISLGDVIGLGPVELEVIDPSSSSIAARGGSSSVAGSAAAKPAAAAKQASGWVLQGDHGSIKGKRYPIDGTMTLGRAPECELSFSFDRLSRKHGQFKEQDGMLTVKDLDSSNGTYVNDKRVTQSRLRGGDVVRFDALSFIVVAPSESKGAAIDTGGSEDMSKTVVRSAIDVEMIQKAAEEAKAAKKKGGNKAKPSSAASSQSSSSSDDSGGNLMVVVVAAIVVIAAIAAGAYFLL